MRAGFTMLGKTRSRGEYRLHIVHWKEVVGSVRIGYEQVMRSKADEHAHIINAGRFKFVMFVGFCARDVIDQEPWYVIFISYSYSPVQVKQIASVGRHPTILQSIIDCARVVCSRRDRCMRFM